MTILTEISVCQHRRPERLKSNRRKREKSLWLLPPPFPCHSNLRPKAKQMAFEELMVEAQLGNWFISNSFDLIGYRKKYEVEPNQSTSWSNYGDLNTIVTLDCIPGSFSKNFIHWMKKRESDSSCFSLSYCFYSFSFS